MRYAEVCVNTPLGVPAPHPGAGDDALGRTFTYAIPDRLAARLQPGHLAWVPFRGRRLQGIVLRLSDAAPQFDVREIISLVWAQPLLTPVQLELAPWISDTYLAPLIDALRLMLPAGLSRRGRTVFVRSGGMAPAGLTARQTELLQRLSARAGDWAEISQGLRGVTQRDDLAPLMEMGLVTQEVEFPSPAPRPKTERQVRLLADADAIARALPSLGRASKQAEALTWLWREAKAGGRSSSVTLEQVCAAVGCTSAPLKALAGRGWVEIVRRAPHAPAQVSLTLAPEAALDAIVQLRGSEKHHAVLNALLGHGGSAWIGWVYAETGATLDTLRSLEAAGLVTIAEEMVWRDPLAGYHFKLDQPPALTEDQQRVWHRVMEQIIGPADQRITDHDSASVNKHPASMMLANRDATQASFVHSSPVRAVLLRGVTGSGKTEIYLRAIDAVLQRGQQAVVLVPEIALTPQTIRRFAARFPGKVTVWHSELGEGERFDVWRRVRTCHPAVQVVIGSRSALFLPFPSLGVIVLDEEHEPSYKQERTPRYHARAVAMALGRLCGATTILGSATPALETYYAAKRGEIGLLTLLQRVRPGEWSDGGMGAWQDALPVADEPASVRQTVRSSPVTVSIELPPVRIVDMRQELRVGNRSMFSRALSTGLRHVLNAGQQAILYLNRRGAASFVLCRDCGYVEVCPRCAVPLTLHGQSETLLCHHCNRRYPVPTTCPSCSGRRIRHFGAGTERVEEAVKLEFPQARTLRWDRDVTGAKGSHDAILSRFVAHEADVLIGTQMIAKGLDLPLVTLVGVVAADTGLFLPDFRAAERTFQLLTQVAGRAGRSTLGGEVIVQTYHPDHYAVVAASNHDYESFYRLEMGFRREQGYPPVRRLARLVYHHGQRAKAQAEAERMAQELRAAIEQAGTGDTDLIGPAPCFFAKQRNEYRWQIVVRSPDPAAPLRRVAVPLGWRLDVDPVDLL